MRIARIDEVPVQDVTHEPVKDCKIQWLISPDDGAPTFSMRRFILGPGGHTPHHSHEWEHVVYVLAGRGKVWVEGNEYDLTAGTALLIAPNEEHHFSAAEDEQLQFLCLVPNWSVQRGAGRANK